MPIADAKKKMIGRQLVEWLYLGIRSGARASVDDYQRFKVKNPALADEYLKRAVNMPLRARARLVEASRLYELENGIGTFNTFLASCLALAGTVTLSELNTDLTTLENYANALIARKQGGEALDSIAADVTANLRDELKDWQFPFPAGYVDQW
jgi:hypothetical protein